MKNKGLLVLLLALAAGCLTFCGMRWHTVKRAHSGVMLDALPELQWLRTDLKLTDAQFDQVRALHLAYRPHCADMCGRIEAEHEKIRAQATADREVTPSLTAALAAHARVHVECQEAMLRHIYQTAAVLEKDQARRYLETILPFALDFSHSEEGVGHGQ